jgi:hypothetical protein
MHALCDPSQGGSTEENPVARASPSSGRYESGRRCDGVKKNCQCPYGTCLPSGDANAGFGASAIATWPLTAIEEIAIAAASFLRCIE